MELTVIKNLKENGLPIVRRMEFRNADLAAYTLNEKGDLVPEVVVEIKKEPSKEAQMQLMRSAESLQTPYALLATPDRLIWFESSTFLPIEPPVFETKNRYIEDPDQLNQVFKYILDLIRENIYSSKYWLYMLQGLLVRTYLFEKSSIEQWYELSQDNYFELLETVYKHYEIDHYVEKPKMPERAFQQFIWKLDEIPPIYSKYNEIILNHMERNGSTGAHMTSPPVKDLFTDIINTLNLNRFSVLDMGVGYGTIATSLLNSNNNIEKLTAIEKNPSIFGYYKMLNIVSGQNKSEVVLGDVLSSENNLQEADVVVVDPPLGGFQEKRDDISNFQVATEGRTVSTLDLFMERATELASPGGYVVALVPESFLFNEKSNFTRSLLKDRMIIESIISLPPHSLKPYTSVKVSMLILRKKKHKKETGENILLANCETIDQFPKAVAGYKNWKSGGDLE